MQIDAVGTELPPGLAGLLDPVAYSHPVTAIEVVQTPISWVLMTGEWAYKVKRPVHLPFADFRLLEHRHFLCREELRLNQRFAPDLYRDVCTIHMQAGRLRVNGAGEIVEYAVRMRQFPGGEQLDRLLASGAGEPALLRQFGAALAGIHARLPVAAAHETWGDSTQISTVILANLDELHVAASRIGNVEDPAPLGATMQARLAASRNLMAQRKAAGCVRECHGDLHMRNIVRREGRLVAFDCLEFEPSFRWIDVADEIAFLHMDLEAGAYPFHANAFLNGYLAASGDYEACGLLDVYAAHRSLVRAKVAALQGQEASDHGGRAALRVRYAAYLREARSALGARKAMLILMYGLSGSGKTWLATQLALRLGAVHIRSDVERKRLAGLSELGDSASGLGQGLYSDEQSSALYRYLAECASHALEGGRHALVDATFLRRVDRNLLRAAVRDGSPVVLVACHAPKDVLLRRAEQRRRSARDASEADAAVIAYQEQHAQALEAEEAMAVINADTTRPDVVGEVLASLILAGAG